MKKYNVYGLGNALLDIEINVSDQDLTSLGLDKGVMTLVDESKQQEIIQSLTNRPHLKSCGGSAANTMITLQQMGCSTFYSCKVSNDVNGQAFVKDLISHGVSTNLSQQALGSGTTGRCLALVSDDAERTMYTHLGVTVDFSSNELNHQAIAESECIYIEGYLVASESARLAAIEAREVAHKHKVMTSITLSDPNMVKFFKNELLEMIGPGVDILFCNEAEAKLFSNSESLDDCCRYLETLAKTFVITKGKQGATLYDGQHYHQISGLNVNVIDTLGAGDAFAGAYLADLLQGNEPLKAAIKANKVAAKVVTHFGARLKERDLAIL
jgi:sugar/nucleoside kinase (ribokinase family)